MPTLGELMEKFGSAAGEGVARTSSSPDAIFNAALEGGQTKTASDGGNTMKTSLQDIYMNLSSMDMNKQAAEAAGAPQEQTAPTDDEMAYAAQKLAAAEAEQLAAEGVDPANIPSAEDEEILKVAADYDAAGRIMARAFYDEFSKIAASGNTKANPNQMTESPSHAAQASLGNRKLPTVPTNFAGSEQHNQGMVTAGGKKVHENALEESRKINAGVTGDDPSSAAQRMGSTAGFATVRDIMG